MLQPLKTNPMLKIMNSTFIDMPSPSTISFYWNYGSLLGISFMMQIVSGLLMSFQYTSDTLLTFPSLILMTRNITNFWFIRWLHANGASLMFILMYFHMMRNIYYFSYKKSDVWLSGVTIFLLTMIIAFLGYVLPWGQMSYWGVTVITNLLTTIPYVGQNIVNWLWGDFYVSNPTLKRFYTLHFLFPFILLALVSMHLLFLHQYGSSNPLNLDNSVDMIHFHPFFSIKDLLGLLVTFLLFLLMILINPLILNDPENFTQANFMSTPIHIQPEWYFLFAYAILRAIPSKIGGVIALLTSIMILYSFPLMNNQTPLKFNPMKKLIYWSFIITFLILTWIGMNITDYPFSFISPIFSFLYFFLIFLMLL